MSLFQIIGFIIGGIAGLGILAGGIGYLFSVFNKGRKQQNTEVVASADQLSDFWKEQVSGFKEVVATLTEKVNFLTGELGKVQGQLTEKITQYEKLEKIFQNRNPETETFMNHVMQSIKDQSEFHLQIVSILKEIHTMTKAEHDRDFKVTATVTKEK